MKKLVAAGVGAALIFSFALVACKKKEAQPVPQVPGMAPQMAPGMQPMPPGVQPQAPGMQPGMQPQMAPGGIPQNLNIPKGETSVVVPESTKGKWSGVKMAITDKTSQKTSEYTIKLHSEFNIPNSNLKIVVGEFLPDFRMEGSTLTSATNTPNNPAVGVRVLEGGNQIFPAPGKKWGWLYARPEFRAMHPFNHPKYTLTLIEGIKKG